MANLRALRLTSADIVIAGHLFLLMARVFDEPSEPLTDDYLLKLLSRPDYWTIAAFMDDELVGGLTAYTLPMTRQPSSEIFIYDIAVRADRQRRGVGRLLVSTLRAAAEAEGIDEIFVPADNEDQHALDFYRSLGGEPAAVTFFAFRAHTPRNP
jgi:aminoglycoside 3-N-acetyltransferase I